MRQLNKDSIDLIQSFEACRLTVYQGEADRPGILTVGWGHVVQSEDNLVLGDMITREEAERLFNIDVGRIVKMMHQAAYTSFLDALTDNQFGACTSLVYNIGIGAWRSSGVLRTITEADPKDAWHNFKSWIHSNGQIVNGLIRRRAAEAALYRDDLDMMNRLLSSNDIEEAKVYLDLED